MRTIFVFLLVLSASYFPQEGISSPSVTEFLGKYLLPRSLKANRALTILTKAWGARDHRFLNLFALNMGEELLIGNVITEVTRYRNLHSVDSHAENIAEHVLGASHAELNRMIAMLNVDTREVFPQLSRLSPEEIKQMGAEVGEFELREFSDVSIEMLSRAEREDQFMEALMFKMTTVHDAVSMSADGHNHIIIGLQKLYVAKEFEKMHDITLAAWRKHYHALSKQEIADNLAEEMQIKERSLNRDRSTMPEPARRLAVEGIERELETLQEMMAALELPSSSPQEATEYLIQQRGLAIIFDEHNTAELYGGIAHDGRISAEYHAALEELGLLGDIFVATHGLEKHALHYLTRTLKKEASR